MKKRVLVIDDENIICISLKEALQDLNFEVETASNGNEGLTKLTKFKPQVVLLDMRLSGESGLELIKEIKNIEKEVEIIMMTAYGDVKTAVTAIKNGAWDYINKPFDIEEIYLLILRALKNIETQKKLYLYEKEKTEKYLSMIGKDESMKEVYDKINILSQAEEVTVLIRGETGTGKEVVASEIHKNSARKDCLMLKINCGAIPHYLVESELFGYEKNAFTGAGAKKKGLLELADGGIVFLDEIGELPYEIQTKLLRFIEDRKFKRVGGLEDIEVDIRIFAATNRDLEKAIKNKEFREDLYYRLNVVPILLPPLRQRGEDVLLIAEHFLDEYNKKFGKEFKGINTEVREKMLHYHWPGNVRELKNVMERIVILYHDEYVRLKHLPPELSQNKGVTDEPVNLQCMADRFIERLKQGDFSLEDEIQGIEKECIIAALKISQNNYSKASQILGISRFALKRKMEKYS